MRIGQEAINNAVRHGRATQVRIALSFEEDRVVLTVADNGCGFVPDEHDRRRPGEHFGLLTMRERAARIRGRLEIVSSPGSGHDDRDRRCRDGGVAQSMPAPTIRVALSSTITA